MVDKQDIVNNFLISGQLINYMARGGKKKIRPNGSLAADVLDWRFLLQKLKCYFRIADFFSNMQYAAAV